MDQPTRSGAANGLRRVVAASLMLLIGTGLETSGAEEAGISGGVVKIGVLGDYGSGRDRGGPGSVTAAPLAAEDVQNQVLGRPIPIS